MWPKQIFARISTTIATGRLKRHSRHSLNTHDKQRKVGRNRSVTKRTLLLWPKQFFVPIAITIASGPLKRHTWNPAHALQHSQVWWKSVSNDGHFTLVAERVLRPCVDYLSIWANQTSYMRFPAHVLQSAQVWWKSVSNEGHFTVLVQTVFRTYCGYHCMAVTHTPYIPISAHVLQPAQVCSKLLSNEGHLTLVAERVFLSLWRLPLHWSDSSVIHGHPCTRTTSSVSLVDIGQ
jgi:hypothetical protein